MSVSWKWVIACFAALILFLSSAVTRSYRRQKKTLDELQKKLVEIRASNKSLQVQNDRLRNDPRAIEQIARQELGLIQPGEIEYRFVALPDERPAK